MSEKKAPSAAQRRRQGFRKGDGRYQATTPCEACGGRTASDGHPYFSHPEVPEGYGLVLCAPCATGVDKLSRDEVIRVCRETAWRGLRPAERRAGGVRS